MEQKIRRGVSVVPYSNLIIKPSAYIKTWEKQINPFENQIRRANTASGLAIMATRYN